MKKSVILISMIVLLSAVLIYADDGSNMLDVNFEKLVSAADIVLDKPVSRSEAGLPVGNGRMGSLVWTSPSALKFQINRVDVYANNKDSKSFYERGSDYCAGAGFVDIDFVDFGADGQCRIRNPWNKKKASLYRNGKKAETLSGSLFKFDTNKGMDVVILPEGTTLNRPSFD